MSSASEVHDPYEIASRVMYELLGRRWVWPPVTAIDLYPFAKTVILSGRPVTEIIEVLDPVGAVIDPATYRVLNGFMLDFVASPASCYYADYTQLADISVEYTYGKRPPEQVRRAIDVLAEELDKAAEGSSACKLPQRVTNISRQGMSMTLLDPQDFLQDGRTGLYEVDLALRVFNPHQAKTRARVFTTTNPPARRISAVANEGTV